MFQLTWLLGCCFKIKFFQFMTVFMSTTLVTHFSASFEINMTFLFVLFLRFLPKFKTICCNQYRPLSVKLFLFLSIFAIFFNIFPFSSPVDDIYRYKERGKCVLFQTFYRDQSSSIFLKFGLFSKFLIDYVLSILKSVTFFSFFKFFFVNLLM